MQRNPSKDDQESLIPARQRAMSLGAGTGSRSFALESWSFVQHKDFQVHVLQKLNRLTKYRPTIPTTSSERLSFLRGYTTTPFKIQMIYLQQMEYATFFWLYVWNVVFRSLSTNYIHVFLSKYTPSEHLFGSKMIPVLNGVSWQVVICGLLQLVSSADILSIFMAYALGWIVDELPWWRCPKKVYVLPPNKVPYVCYDLKEFRNIAMSFGVCDKGRNITFTHNFYRWNMTEEHRSRDFLFTVSPMHHFMQTWVKTSVLENGSYLWILCFAVIWISAGAFYKQLYKKYLWKLCQRSQIIQNSLCVIVLFLITWRFLQTDTMYKARIYNKKGLDLAAEWDFDFLAESMTGPPVVHVLYARSPVEVNPGWDSTLITISNSVMYFFKSLVNYQLKTYIESVYRAPIMCEAFTNPFPVFYLWPFFFEDLHLTTKLFYTVTFVVEFVIFVITYQILVEVMVCEWSLTRRWIATVILSATGLLLSIVFNRMTKSLMYCVSNAITSLTEVLLVCWCYPLERLSDDVHFINGNAMRTWRKWGLRLLPWYHIYKTYTMFQAFWFYNKTKKGNFVDKHLHSIMEDTSSVHWVWAVVVIPLPIGAMYAIVKYIAIQKQNWRVLLKPRPDWGPQEHVTRQLRKQFDYREYVGSQAPRFLSRHILAQSQTPTYRLDICYEDIARKRSTVTEDMLLKDHKLKKIFDGY